VTEELSRQALYEFVWAMPAKTLAQRFNISDGGLRKACQRSHIPFPPAGFPAPYRLSARGEPPDGQPTAHSMSVPKFARLPARPCMTGLKIMP